MKPSDEVRNFTVEADDDGIRLDRWFKRHLPQIGHIHTAGVPGRHELLGSENDYAALFRAIDASGYDGYVGLEFRPTIGEEAALAQTLGLLSD